MNTRSYITDESADDMWTIYHLRATSLVLVDAGVYSQGSHVVNRRMPPRDSARHLTRCDKHHKTRRNYEYKILQCENIDA